MKKLIKSHYPFEIRKIASSVEVINEKDIKIQKDIQTKKLRLFIALPVLCIALAELLIFLGKTEVAIGIHITVLLSLSLSYLLIKDQDVHKIHMPLMLLPVLRIVNLSMPIFFETTIPSLVLYYIPLAIPVFAIIIHQRNSFEEIGITRKHLLIYIVLAIPLGFLLGLGEYLIIQPRYMIPNLTFINLLKLTIVMVFFVGLIEELIFRSILQTRLEKLLSFPEALLITSILFGLMHSGYGTYYEIIYASLVGLYMGFIFHVTKSLPFIAVMHGFINVFLFGILPHVIGWTWF